MEVVARVTMPVFIVALGLMVAAIPLTYWASDRFPPAWRWLMAYVGLIGLAVFVLSLT